jgi:hypothetical protein
MTWGVHWLDFYPRLKFKYLAIIYLPIAGVNTLLGSSNNRDAGPLLGKHLVVASVVMVFVGRKNSFWLAIYFVPDEELHHHLEVAGIHNKLKIPLNLTQVLNRAENNVSQVVCQVGNWHYTQIPNLINRRLIFQCPLDMGVHPVGSNFGKLSVVQPSSYW